MGYKHDIDDVLDKGTELFRTRGYHQVGINDILKECGIPKGSFYNFFKTKEDFAQKIIERYGQSSKNMIEGYLHEKSLSPLDRLKSFYRMLVDSNVADNYAGGCLINTLSNEVGHTHDVLGTEADLQFNRWLEVISECVEEGQEAGQIRKDFTPLQLAEYLHAGLYGAFPRMKVTHSNKYLNNWYTMTFEFIEA